MDKFLAELKSGDIQINQTAILGGMISFFEEETYEMNFEWIVRLYNPHVTLGAKNKNAPG